MEQVPKQTVRIQLGFIPDGLVVELVDDLFVGQALTSGTLNGEREEGEGVC